MKKTDEIITPKDQYEAMLFSLPKNCGCHICTKTMELIKNNIEKKRLKLLCKKLDIDIAIL